MRSPFAAWVTARATSRRARAVVTAIRCEPDAADAEWLADVAAGGDVDHARWELRYARAVMGQLVAERDLLDDASISAVARAMVASIEDDPHVAVDRGDLARAQYADRLRAYREAFQARGGMAPSAELLGRCLLAFASDGARTAGAPLAYAVELVARYEEEAGRHLRAAFGEAHLPEDLPPSALAGR
jgi:hypothetical protein